MITFPFFFCCWLIQFRAICEGVFPNSLANPCTSLAIDSDLSFTKAELIGLFGSNLLTSLSFIAALYLPESTPPARGDQAIEAISSALAIGNSSLSALLSTRLYNTWMAENWVQPRNSAIVLA